MCTRLPFYCRFFLIFCGIHLLFNLNLQAQSTFTISGVLKDAASGETLIGANVYLNDGSTGTITNEYGFYSLSVAEDTVLLTFSYIGLAPVYKKIYLNADTTINLELAEGVEMKEIVVKANSNQERVNSTQMGMEELTAQEAKQVVAVFGEVDVLKVLQLKPGIQSGSEGSSGLFVRGGAADQTILY